MKKIIMLFIFVGIISKWGVVAGFLGLPGAQVKYSVGEYTSANWYRNYNGYQDAQKVSDDNKVPMFIYVYTDWCKYCKKFNQELLTNDKIIDSLSKFVKVKVNPEKGELEKSLAVKWKSRGYPAILINSDSNSNNPKRIRAPYTRQSSGWRLMSPQEFISMLEKNGA